MVWEINHVTSRNRNPFKILENKKQEAQKVKKEADFHASLPHTWLQEESTDEQFKKKIQLVLPNLW